MEHNESILNLPTTLGLPTVAITGLARLEAGSILIFGVGIDYLADILISYLFSCQDMKPLLYSREWSFANGFSKQIIANALAFQIFLKFLFRDLSDSCG